MANQFSGTGNIGKDLELRQVVVNGRTTHVLEMRVFFDAYKENAKGELVQDEVSSFWKSVTLWGERGERAYRHLSKGSRIHVVGYLKGEAWVDKNSGEKRTTDGVVADDVFLSFSRVESVTFRPKRDDASDSAAPEPATTPAEPAKGKGRSKQTATKGA